METDRNIFLGMPSLIKKRKLEFDNGWPRALILPSPFSTKKDKKQQKPEQKRKFMQITDCQHYFRKHYAKNMCKNCYIKVGRDRFAYKCEHTDRAHYAMGICQLCYLKFYNKKKKAERKAAQMQ